MWLLQSVYSFALELLLGTLNGVILFCNMAGMDLGNLEDTRNCGWEGGRRIK